MSIGCKKSFWKLITDDAIERIEIPQIQRDYVQGRNTAAVNYARENLLTSLCEALTVGKNVDLNYIYGKKDKFGIYVPIDGQQRLTTLFALHLYVFSKEASESRDKNRFDKLNLLGKKFKYKTRVTTERFLDKLVNEHMFVDFFSSPLSKENTAGAVEKYIHDCSWFSYSWKTDPTINSLIVVLDAIHEKLDCDNIHERLCSEKCPISFMELSMDDIGKENDLYIKMNSRGEALTEFEAFKSEMFELVDNDKVCEKNLAKLVDEVDKFKKQFKSKIDNDFLQLIWENCVVFSDVFFMDYKDEYSAIYCDLAYIYLISNIITNRAVCNHQNVDGLTNKGFFNFNAFKPILQKGQSLYDIYKTLELINNLDDKKLLTYITDELVSFKQTKKDGKYKINYLFTHPQKVMLFAITHFAVNVPTNEENRQLKFKHWYRIMHNLIENTEIDQDKKVEDAVASIYNLDKGWLIDANAKFADLYEKPEKYIRTNLQFFDEQQIREEALKCQIIKAEESWFDILYDAERHGYFNGQIDFALKLCEIDTPDKQAGKRKLFKENWEVVKILFGQDDIIDRGPMFRRALLTFGDYSEKRNETGKMTFYYESGKYFKWKRLLRGENKEGFNVFKTFFQKFKKENNHDANAVLEKFVNDYTNCHSIPTNDIKEEFIYYLVTLDGMMEYMNKYIYQDQNDAKFGRRIFMLKGEAANGEYIDFKIYALKLLLDDYAKKDICKIQLGESYFDSDTSVSAITKIDKKSCKVEFKQNKFYINNTVTQISSVEKMKQYLIDKLAIKKG